MPFKDKERRKQYHKEWYEKNKEKIQLYGKQYRQKNRQKIKECKRQYYQENKERENEHKRQYRQRNIKERREYERQYRQGNREKLREINRRYYWRNREELLKRIKECHQQRRRIDPKYRLDCNMATAIWISLKGQKAGRKWEILVNYTLKDLTKHLESQFDDNMNWNNYGSYWWIDHIKPRSLFHYISPEDSDFKCCWSLANLQPMEKIENIKKGNYYNEEIK